MDVAVKAAVAAVGCTLCCLIIKKSAPELSLALAVAASVAITLFSVRLIDGLADIVDLARGAAGLSPAVLSPVFKCVGIGVVTKTASDLCADSGEKALSSAVELGGTVCALCAAAPLIEAVLTMVEGAL